mmetsp:Transcript_26801/g.58131  ORF Transcript_26801/g.58131 Transcript_26801/m.58131 type:complete len:541 (+) Transcript_26801:350-1972(+)
MIAEGILLLLLSLVCLGTWPAILRLCTYAAAAADGDTRTSSRSTRSTYDSKERSVVDDYEYEHHSPPCLRKLVNQYAQRRHPCHAYIDYATAYVIFSATVPILLSYLIDELDTTSTSSSGDNTSNGDDININDDDGEQDTTTSSSSNHQAVFHQLPLVVVASVGGSLLSLGNISTQWATTVFRAPLTTVLALQASLTVVVGTTINYHLEPSKTARPDLLAGGVGLFLLAIGLSVVAQNMYANDNSSTGGDGYGDIEEEDGASSIAGISMRAFPHHSPASSGPRGYRSCGSSDDGSAKEMKKSSSDVFLKELEKLPSDLFEESPSCIIDGYTVSSPLQVRASSTQQIDEPDSLPLSSSSTTGLVVAICGGLCFGFFSPAFNIAVNDPFEWSRNAGKDRNSTSQDDGAGLSVATANFWFSFAFAASSVFWNLHLMKSPPVSTPDVTESSLRRYLGESIRDRTLAIWAGLVCAAGNVLQFQGGHLTGYASCDLVQAFPLVATVWDVAAFGEFQGARRIIIVCLGCMYLVYIGGIVLLASSISY